MRALVLPSLLVLAACAPAAPSSGPGGSSPPPEVLGVLDGVDSDGVLSGWAVIPARPEAAVQVTVTVDGDATSGTVLGTIAASKPRADVNAALDLSGDHGFALALPGTLRDGKSHALHAYAAASKGLVELDRSPVSVTLAVPCATAGPLVAPAAGEYVVTLQASSGKFVAAECGGDDDGILHANRDTAGEWENFYALPSSDGTLTLRSSHGRLLSAEGGGGAAVHANRAAVGPWEQFTLEGALKDGTLVSFVAHDGAHRVSAHAVEVDATASTSGATERFTLHVLVSPIHARPGVVHADGRNFVDDEGPFYPMGATVMWALEGWKTDRARLKQNLAWLASHRVDSVRILGEVDWGHHEIDPTWPDYRQVLGEFLDCAYGDYGLRTELTLVGSNGDPLDLAQKAAAVINAGRQQMILDVEVANESYGRPVTLAQLQAAGRYLRQNVPNLVALSSGEGLSSYAPNSTDWRADYVRIYLPSDAATLGTIHMDRTQGDDGWREVRQPWDWKDFPFPVAHNEPIGPRSSVAQEVDPVRLAMLRAVGLINGVEAFVLHNGAGVAGVADPARDRPANLWEVPGIDAVMDAVRGVDAWLPTRVGDGQHWNNAWAGNPMVADAFWSDGADHGVNRNYTVATADGWVSTVAGVKDHVVLTSSRHALVEVFDVLKGKVQEVELQAGQTLTLLPVSKDDHGYGAFIVVGHYR